MAELLHHASVRKGRHDPSWYMRCICGFTLYGFKFRADAVDAGADHVQYPPDEMMISDENT